MNAGLGANIRPIAGTSRDVSACSAILDDLHLLLFNVYNPPKSYAGFEAMDTLMRSLPLSVLSLPTIIVNDANIHSCLWNPGTYGVHDASSDVLVEDMTQWDMTLRSPKGIVTFESNSDKHPGTTIDLVWVNQQADDLITACLVDEEYAYNHHSDHRALVTVIRKKFDAAPCQESDKTPAKNWHKLEHAQFISGLKASLSPLSPITTHTDIENLDNHLTTVITAALEASSPARVSAFKHKSWWNPITMIPLRKAAAKARRLAKSHPNDEN